MAFAVVKMCHQSSYSMTMHFLVVVVVVVGVTLVAARQEQLVFKSGKSVDLWSSANDTGRALGCRHTRAEMAQTVITQLDVNGDECIDMDEMHDAFGACLAWYERAAMSVGSVIGSIETPETTMDACDRNGDRRMCIEDVLRTQHECEAYSVDDFRAGRSKNTCLCTCSSMDELYKFVLDRYPCT